MTEGVGSAPAAFSPDVTASTLAHAEPQARADGRPGMSAAGRTSLRARYAWAGYAGVAIPVIFVLHLLPSRALAGIILSCLVSASAGVAILAGVRMWRPQPRLPWLLLALGQATYVVADVTCYVSHDVLGTRQLPGPSDVVYLAHYPLVVVALVLLVRGRSPGRGLAERSWTPRPSPSSRRCCRGCSSWAADPRRRTGAGEGLLRRGSRGRSRRARRRPAARAGARPAAASSSWSAGSLLAVLAADTWYVWR